MTSLPQPGSLVADKYRVEHLIGEGGMGAVFRAQHLLMDRPVALKCLRPELAQHPDARDRFLREARAAGRIHHPNVVDVYDVGMHDDALFMVMELLEGEHFEDVMQRGDITTARTLELLVGAMRGVAAAHRHGIVHRDIKPENLFVVWPSSSKGALIKVLDFGISKLVDEVPRSARLTQEGAVVGTPLFMSFEQLSGARDVDARADVYSFGVLLYRALTGIIPFDAESVAAIAVLIATYRPPAPKQLRSELPDALSQVVMKAMAFDRKDRYGSVDELIAALMSLDASHGILGHCDERDRALPGAPLVAAGAPELTTLDIPAPIGPAGSVLPAGRMSRWLRVASAAAVVGVVLSLSVWLLSARVSTQAQRHAEPMPAATAPAASSSMDEAPMTMSPTSVEARDRRSEPRQPLTPARGVVVAPAPVTLKRVAPAPLVKAPLVKAPLPKATPLKATPLKAPLVKAPLLKAPPKAAKADAQRAEPSPAHRLLRNPDF